MSSYLTLNRNVRHLLVIGGGPDLQLPLSIDHVTDFKCFWLSGFELEDLQRVDRHQSRDVAFEQLSRCSCAALQFDDRRSDDSSVLSLERSVTFPCFLISLLRSILCWFHPVEFGSYKIRKKSTNLKNKSQILAVQLEQFSRKWTEISEFGWILGSFDIILKNDLTKLSFDILMYSNSWIWILGAHFNQFSRKSTEIFGKWVILTLCAFNSTFENSKKSILGAHFN